jgi:hypothetical protein
MHVLVRIQAEKKTNQRTSSPNRLPPRNKTAKPFDRLLTPINI